MAKVSIVANIFLGRYSAKEHEDIVEKTRYKGRMNRVLIGVGIPYPQR